MEVVPREGVMRQGMEAEKREESAASRVKVVRAAKVVGKAG